MSDDPNVMWNTIDVFTDILLIVGLAGFARTGAAGGWLGRVGLTLAFARLGVFTLAGVLSFSAADNSEALHPISVP
jgi:hypothetical protein